MDISISIRDMIEFVYRSGSIDSSITQTYLLERAVEGIQVHKKVQKHREEEALKNNNIYESEVSLNFVFKNGNHTVKLSGRADGVLITDSKIILEELKSTHKNLDSITPQLLHTLQMELYGYFYCIANCIDEIYLHLTYIDVDTLKEKTFDYAKTQDELYQITKQVCEKYCEFLDLEETLITQRNNTVSKVPFPHKQYRQNQRDLMKSVYYAINQENNIFIEAPTGTGKTISTLFPSIKALGLGIVEKVFYVTAKTITRQVAKKSMLLLEENGLIMRSVVLTAKDKICFLDEVNCTPEHCPYANGHFDRINSALFDILENETVMYKELIEKYSKKHQVCPFEFGLDISNFCDVIIGDYNYVYNPTSKLIRYFTEGGEYVVLVDEAHNLYDRACDMYSSTINSKSLQKLIDVGINSKVVNSTTKIVNMIDKFNDLENFESIELDEFPKDIVNRIRTLQSIIKADEELMSNAQVRDIYLEIIDFTKMADIYTLGHTIVVKRIFDNISIKILCLNPSTFLYNASLMSKCTVFFSATLTPTNYFRDVYGGNSKNLYSSVPSPFDPNNTQVLINTSIKTTYKDRSKYYNDIVSNIYEMISSKVGNYFVFFSSYEYLKNVLTVFKSTYPDVDVLPQLQNMSDIERDYFINEFIHNPSKTKVGFVVLGGVFGEGVDLIGDRLIGVCVVGVGLPMLTFERNLIKNSFEANGYDYAYTYPGFNKVMQGVGRLIRTESDKGIILLLDERYSYSKYKSLFPNSFKNLKYIKTSSEVKLHSKNFWLN